MVWTTASMPQYLAKQYETTEQIIVEGAESDTLGYVNDHHVPVSHSSVYTHEHDSYGDALRFAFGVTAPSSAIGQPSVELAIDEDKLTVVTADER